MTALVLDFESTYDPATKYSLSSMTTVEYIQDPRFQTIGVAVAPLEGDSDPVWVPGPQVHDFLHSIDWKVHGLVAQNCLTPDHEFLSPTGWVRMDAWAGESVAQWDTDGSIIFARPTAYIDKAWSGDLVVFNTINHKGRYTPDHGCIQRQTSGDTEWRRVTALEMATGPVNNRELPVAGFLDGAGIKLPDDAIRLIEAIRADGSYGGVNAKRQSVNPKFHLKKPRKIHRLTGILDALGQTYRMSPTATGTLVSVGASDLMHRLFAMLTKHKTYGPWVFDMSARQRAVLVEEMQYWDGVPTVSELGGVRTLATARIGEAGWIQAIMATTGYKTTAALNKDNNRGFSAGRTDRIIHLVNGTAKAHARVRPATNGARLRVARESYNGRVYCFTVPSGAFLVRREGAVWVTGNCNFDGGILGMRYGIKPAFMMDTLAMAAASHVAKIGGKSLAAISAALINAGYILPPKGDEVVRAAGKRFEDFSPWELAKYGEYCKDDVRSTRVAARVMMEMLPISELQWADQVIKSYTDPALVLNKPRLEAELVRVLAMQATTLDVAAKQHNCTPVQFRALLQSNQKFADLLRGLGVEPPMKTSKATGKETYAFAKTDEGMTDLLDHDSLFVQIFAAARLANKSTIQQTRLVRMIDLADRGPMGMPYSVSGTHTHRISAGAGQAVNVANMPSGRAEGQTNEIRRSIEAPEGFVILAADSAQVEVRIGAYIANETEMLSGFAHGDDIYSVLGATLFNRTYEDLRAGVKAGDPTAMKQRQMGKAGILGAGYGSGPVGFLVYCKTVAKVPMEASQAADIVEAYRSKYSAIREMWHTCDKVIKAMLSGQSGEFGGPDGKLFRFDGSHQVLGVHMPTIFLPCGMSLAYPGLDARQGEKYVEYFYYQTKGRNKVMTGIYGSKLFENLCQALANSALKFQILNVTKRYRMVMSLYDEGVFLVPEAEAEEALAFATEKFAEVPEWLLGCPLKGEAKYAKNYGDT